MYYRRREERKRRRIRYVKNASFQNYIRQVLKKFDVRASLSSEAVAVIDSILFDAFHDLAQEARHMMVQKGQRTLTEWNVHSATHIYFKGEVDRHAVDNAMRAITMYADLNR